MNPNYPNGFLRQNLESCMTKTTCEGACKPHSDGLRVVRIVDYSGIVEHDWGYYCYCPEAIKEDKFRGFSVLSKGDYGFEPEE
jgi:hypothetical protein